MSKLFSVDIDLRPWMESNGRLVWELEKRLLNVVEDVAMEMTEAAKSLLPSHWLLRSVLIPRAFYYKKRRTFTATISLFDVYATMHRSGRQFTSSEMDQRRRKQKGMPTLAESNPRRYAWWHDEPDARYTNSRTRNRPRRFVADPKSRFGPILVSRVQATLQQFLGGTK